MMDFKAVVFDMDGVLLDTERVVLRCWKEIADRHGIEEIEQTCARCLGMNSEATIRLFKERYGEDFPYDIYKEEMRELFFGSYYQECLTVKAGVRELLAALKERGIRLAVASSTRRAVVIKELTDAHLAEFFDEFVCGDMVLRSKPDPEIFVKACEVLGVETGMAYAIEDSYNGIRSAYAGGLKPIMVPDLKEADEEMRRLSCQILPDCFAVKEYLLG